VTRAINLCRPLVHRSVGRVALASRACPAPAASDLMSADGCPLHAEMDAYRPTSGRMLLQLDSPLAHPRHVSDCLRHLRHPGMHCGGAYRRRVCRFGRVDCVEFPRPSVPNENYGQPSKASSMMSMPAYNPGRTRSEGWLYHSQLQCFLSAVDHMFATTPVLSFHARYSVPLVRQNLNHVARTFS